MGVDASAHDTDIHCSIRRALIQVDGYNNISVTPDPWLAVRNFSRVDDDFGIRVLEYQLDAADSCLYCLHQDGILKTFQRRLDSPIHPRMRAYENAFQVAVQLTASWGF